MYILHHASTNTYYGTKRINNDKSISIVKNSVPPFLTQYNIMCFKRFSDALLVADSISIYKKKFKRNPSCDTIYICNEHDLELSRKTNFISQELIIAESTLEKIIYETKRYNIGIAVINSIQNDNRENVVVEMDQLITINQEDNFFSFTNVLEDNLKL